MIVYDKCTNPEGCDNQGPIVWCRILERPIATCSDCLEKEGDDHKYDMPMSEEEYALWQMSHRENQDEL